MITEEQVKKLISENEFLQVQLQDVNEMIAAREEELALLREKARQSVQTRSDLDTAYEELAYMQNVISKHQQKAVGAASREASMEEELVETIRMEKEYYEIKKQFESSSAALADINQQLSEAATIYKQLADAKRKIAELESKLDIANEEKELLAYEISRLKKKSESTSESPDK